LARPLVRSRCGGRLVDVSGTETMTAKVFEDRQWRGDWRVEWFDDDGGCEVAIFSGPNARERALGYANTTISRRSP
jgi:hypothetical protein